MIKRRWRFSLWQDLSLARHLRACFHSHDVGHSWESKPCMMSCMHCGLVKCWASRHMDIPAYILNHKAVVNLYGRWPSFHDAQVLDYDAPALEGYSLAFTVHTWQMTDKVDAKGYFVLEKHALVSFRFDAIFDVQMAAFDSGNILFGLEFFPSTDDSSFRVVLDSVMDKSGSFSARKGEVVSVIPCTPDGHKA